MDNLDSRRPHSTGTPSGRTVHQRVGFATPPSFLSQPVAGWADWRRSCNSRQHFGRANYLSLATDNGLNVRSGR